MLFTDNLPTRETLADWLLYLASGTQDKEDATIPEDLASKFLARQGSVYYWFIYEPNRDFLAGPDAALTLDLARRIAKVDPKAEHRVFSPVKYVSNKLLRAEGLRIEHAPIPFALFRKGAE